MVFQAKQIELVAVDFWNVFIDLGTGSTNNVVRGGIAGDVDVLRALHQFRRIQRTVSAACEWNSVG